MREGLVWGVGAGKAGLVTQYVLSSHGTLLHVVTCWFELWQDWPWEAGRLVWKSPLRSLLQFMMVFMETEQAVAYVSLEGMWLRSKMISGSRVTLNFWLVHHTDSWIDNLTSGSWGWELLSWVLDMSVIHPRSRLEEFSGGNCPGDSLSKQQTNSLGQVKTKRHLRMHLPLCAIWLLLINSM